MVTLEVGSVILPTGALIGLFGVGVKEFIAHLRRRDATVTTLTVNLTRLTDHLLGIDGRGGLSETVHQLGLDLEGLEDRTAYLERKVLP